MRKFVYPVILFKSEDEESYTILISDLDIVSTGDTVEKAYLSAEDYLETFLKFAIKMQAPITPATSFADTEKLNPKRTVLLVSVSVDGAEELTSAEEEYKNFLHQFVYQSEE